MHALLPIASFVRQLRLSRFLLPFHHGITFEHCEPAEATSVSVQHVLIAGVSAGAARGLLWGYRPARGAAGGVGECRPRDGGAGCGGLV